MSIAQQPPVEIEPLISITRLTDDIADLAIDLAGRKNIPLGDAITIATTGMRMLLEMPEPMPAVEDVDLADLPDNVVTFPVQQEIQ